MALLGYLLWLLVGVGIGVYVAPTVERARVRLRGYLRELDELDRPPSRRSDDDPRPR